MGGPGGRRTAGRRPVRGAASLPAGSVLAAAVLVAACSGPTPAGSTPVTGGRGGGAGTTPAAAGPSRSGDPRPAGAVPAATGRPVPAGHAPSRVFPVADQTLTVRSGPGRVLPTTVWYPARSARHDAPAAAGTFPLILFSHGLLTLPADYAPLLRRWASAGFVVVAPAYPNTRRGAGRLDLLDVPRQPQDASAVLSAVLGGRLLHARVDPGRIGAAGHSAGGITTVGLFTSGRDPRLVAGVVLAGSGLGVGTAFTGPPAWLLFVHGDADPLVPYAGGLEAYRGDPWPKEFLTLPGQGHRDPYLAPGTASFTLVAAVTTDFWRLALDGDRAAGRRVGADVRAGTVAGVPARLDGTLGTG